jgi:thymidylate synthase
MQEYKNLVNRVLTNGEDIKGRNGDTIQIVGDTFNHDMRTGFPCLTLRHLNHRLAITELRFFLQGKTNIEWLNERGNHFWDKFASKKGELGPVYGRQWLNFNEDCELGFWGDGSIEGRQLDWVLHELKKDQTSRRLLVSAWNPLKLDKMCLPPCHDSFQFISNGKDLDLVWRQRSCDIAVGLPWDMQLYGFLLSVVAVEVGMQPRWLIGQFGSLHLYKAHEGKMKDLMIRNPWIPPKFVYPIGVSNFLKRFTEEDEFSNVVGIVQYEPHEPMKFEVIP